MARSCMRIGACARVVDAPLPQATHPCSPPVNTPPPRGSPSPQPPPLGQWSGGVVRTVGPPGGRVWSDLKVLLAGGMGVYTGQDKKQNHPLKGPEGPERENIISAQGSRPKTAIASSSTLRQMPATDHRLTINRPRVGGPSPAVGAPIHTVELGGVLPLLLLRPFRPPNPAGTEATAMPVYGGGHWVALQAFCTRRELPREKGGPVFVDQAKSDVGVLPVSADNAGNLGPKR